MSNARKEKEDNKDKDNSLLGLKKHSPKKEMNQLKENENTEDSLETEFYNTKLIGKDKFKIKKSVITS